MFGFAESLAAFRCVEFAEKREIAGRKQATRIAIPKGIDGDTNEEYGDNSSLRSS